MLSALLTQFGLAVDGIVWGMLGIPTIGFVEGLTDIIYALQNIGL